MIFYEIIYIVVIICNRRGIIAGPIISYGPATEPRRGHMIAVIYPLSYMAAAVLLLDPLYHMVQQRNHGGAI